MEHVEDTQALIAEFPSRGPGLEDGARANDVLERIAVFLPWLPLPAGYSDRFARFASRAALTGWVYQAICTSFCSLR